MDTVAHALTGIVRLAHKISRDLPRNFDVAALRDTVHRLAAARRLSRRRDRGDPAVVGRALHFASTHLR
jgi:hypothetical protein